MAQRAAFSGFVMLQGAWEGGDTMLTTLNQKGYLPLHQPFGSGPLQYAGTDSLPAIPADMVDWILIELGISPDTVYDRRAAWLNKYGQIMSVDGSPEVRFNAKAGDYFVTIRHPSHLAVMTAFPVSLPLPHPCHWDFRNPQQFPAYGNCTIQLPSGPAAMISGDLNQDNVLRYSGPSNDRSLVLQRIGLELGSSILTSTVNGYFPEDISMDGTLRYSGPGNDPSRIIQNLINLTGSMAITASYAGCVPSPVVLPPPPYEWMCGDPFTDTRDAQVYPTTRISTQCWFSKNLNVGNFVWSDSTGIIHSNANDSSAIEKYCYHNDPMQCEWRGGLYDWNEAMAYDTLEGSRGICPEDWHIPTDQEWMVLEGNADHQFTDALQPEWQNTGWRGSDAGAILKIMGLWPSGDMGNPLRFDALPAGVRAGFGYYTGDQVYTAFWTSSKLAYPNLNVARRVIFDGQNSIGRDYRIPATGYAVRCLQDSIYPCAPVPDRADAGPDRLDVPGTAVVLNGNTPPDVGFLWRILAGNGGVLADTTSPEVLLSGEAGESYTLEYILGNRCGETRDTISVSFLPAPAQMCGDTFTDARNGRTYRSIRIGTRRWMAENLDIGNMVISYPADSNHSEQTDNGIIEKYCYNNDPGYCRVYGGLYEWNEAMVYDSIDGGRGICPLGWHLPTDEEWKEISGMADHIYGPADPIWDTTGWRGFDTGGGLKSQGFALWREPNLGADNRTCFSALPGAYRYRMGQFYGHRTEAVFWTSASVTETQAIMNYISFEDPGIYRGYWNKRFGFSVRCVQDSIYPCYPMPDQAQAGPDSAGIAGTVFLLDADIPLAGKGWWSILSGQGGNVDEIWNPKSVFAGLAGETYVLKWTVRTGCGVSEDTLILGFAPW
jgi:uncharacterized protein (TIGR02145 family)